MNSHLKSHHNINAAVILCASVAAIAGILFGFDTGVISGAILFIKGQFKLTDVLNGLVVSAVLIGAFAGALFSGRLADHYGRRNLLLITATIFLIGTLGSAMSDTVWQLVTSRILVGLAIGLASFIAPLYISEIAPARYRGALVSLNQLAVTIGILFAYIVDVVFSKHGAWRYMLGMGMIPAALLFIGVLFLPSSPRWLVYKGRQRKARDILKKIRGLEDVEAELTEIENSLRQRGSWKLILQKWLRPALIICFGLSFFQQFTGINTIIYYAPTIFQFAGFKSATVAILATAGVGLVNVGFTIVAIPLVDRIGRKPLLLIGVAGMAVSLLALSLAFHLDSQLAILKWIAFFSVLVYIASFAISLGPIMWLMFAEVFPLEIRGLGTSLAASSNWAFNGIVAFTFLTLIHWFGESGTFLLYGTMSIAGLLFILNVVPETKGCSLEQIEANLRSGVTSRHLGR